MIRTTLTFVVLLAVSSPAFAQSQQPTFCGTFAYPWQGKDANGDNAFNTAITVPPGFQGIYPVDIYFPAAGEPQPTRFSLVSWMHRFPDAPTGTLSMAGLAQVWPPRSTTQEAQYVHLEDNLAGDTRFVTKNMSMPLAAGMRYTVGAWNLTGQSVNMNLIITTQVCFASLAELDWYRANQGKPGEGAPR